MGHMNKNMSKPLKLPVSFEHLKKLKAKAESAANEEFYYTAEYAAVVKKILDTLHENKVPVRTRPVGHSLSTMRIQYYHGLHYLVDHDETGKYKQLGSHTICKIRKGEFLEFSIRDSILESKIELVTPWREELMEYLNEATTGKKFFKPDVSLTKDDIEWINNQLAGLVKGNGDPLFIAQVEPGMPLLLIRDTE